MALQPANVQQQQQQPQQQQSSTALSQPQPQAAQATPQPQALAPVQRAARTINESLQRDANFPDLDTYVRRESRACYQCSQLTCVRGHLVRVRTPFPSI